jgi:hypothetical protein
MYNNFLKKNQTKGLGPTFKKSKNALGYQLKEFLDPP